MRRHANVTRRGFLRAAAAAAVPYLVPASVRGATAPSNRITVASIGTGNQGFNDLKKFLALEDAQVVAVCDVNRASYGYRDDTQFYGREPRKRPYTSITPRKRPRAATRAVPPTPISATCSPARMSTWWPSSYPIIGTP